MGLGVIIPAAGEGQRLRPHTLRKPKVMLEVAGKPIIGHILDRVSRLNPDRIWVVVPPADEWISSYLQASYRRNFEFVVQSEPRGLGHAVWCAGADRAGLPLLILLGDTIVDFDFQLMFQADYSIGVKEVSDPSRFGVVLVENGVVSRVIEKPREPVSRLAIVGIYYFRESKLLYQSLERLIAENRMIKGEYQFTDALQFLANQGAGIRTVDVDVWLDCGTPEALLETNRLLLERQKTALPELNTVRIVPPVFIAPDARIERSEIGPYVSVSAGAQISGSVVKDSLIYQGARVANCRLSGAIVGEDAEVRGVDGAVNVGPGVHLARG